MAAAAEDKPADASGKPRAHASHVGQELNYDGQFEFKQEAATWKTKSSWKLLVVRQNVDGGWRLLVRYATARGG